MTRMSLRILPLLAITVLLPVGGNPCCATASTVVQMPGGPPVQGMPSATKSAEAGDNAAAPAKKLDLDTLIERLKQTQAIGVLTKLVLRSDVNDLIDEVRRYKRTKGTESQLERIKAHFNGLLLKVLTLLNDDPKLAQDIQRARDNLWQHLMEVKA